MSPLCHPTFPAFVEFRFKKLLMERSSGCKTLGIPQKITTPWQYFLITSWVSSRIWLGAETYIRTLSICKMPLFRVLHIALIHFKNISEFIHPVGLASMMMFGGNSDFGTVLRSKMIFCLSFHPSAITARITVKFLFSHPVFLISHHHNLWRYRHAEYQTPWASHSY